MSRHFISDIHYEGDIENITLPRVNDLSSVLDDVFRVTQPEDFHDYTNCIIEELTEKVVHYPEAFEDVRFLHGIVITLLERYEYKSEAKMYREKISKN